MSSAQLLQAAQRGDLFAVDRLVVQHDGLVRAIASRFRVPDGTVDDLVQVGRTGLWQAIRDFRPDKGSSFETFAARCIRSEVMNEVTRALRLKHRVLNQASSLESPRDAGGEPLQDTLPCVAERHDPVARLEQREQLELLALRMRELSDLERRCLLIQAGGGRHADMVCELEVPRKMADNALQRARRKIAADF